MILTDTNKLIMEAIKTTNITNALRTYCDRYERQNKGANSLTGVSASTIIQMLNGNWEMSKDDLVVNLCDMVGYKAY